MNEALSLLAAVDVDLVSAGGALIFSVTAMAGFGAAAVRQDAEEMAKRAKLLVDALVRLAGQDASVVIPLRDSEDELGEIARALQQVRANFIEQLQHQADLQQSNDELHLALDSMTQGLCMYDSKQRLIVCNRRYAEMYSIPKELTRPGTSYRQILESRRPGKVTAEQALADIE